MKTSQNKLFSCFFPNDEATHRLFCFPCAGGDVTMFRDWYQYLPDTEVWCANLPGRGVLSSTPYPENFADLIHPILAELSKDFTDKPIMLLGHSFGALVAYALALDLQRNNEPVEALLVCARRGPERKGRYDFSAMSDEQVLGKLIEMNSIPDELMQSEELLSFYLKVIIRDLVLNETIVSTGQPLSVPLYIYAGAEDAVVSLEDIAAWQTVTTGAVVQRDFAGDHLFIVKNREPFLDQLSLDIDAIQGIEA